ncbi:amine oxidase [Xylogone sp. PMI_703]|nr:amine oxidase [Xylogone sp. PMI_703]
MTRHTIKNGTVFSDSPAVQDPQFYSHGVSISGNERLVFTSGQIGCDKDGNFPEATIDQVKLAFENLEKVLQASGAQVRDVVKLTFYFVDWSITEAERLLGPCIGFLTDIHGVQFRPLTTLVPVTALAFPNAKFEVEAVAAVKGVQHFPAGSQTIFRQLPPVETDVVVIGGGFSGLQAARDVHAAGLRTVLLEANGRIGGRSHSISLSSGPGTVELGATWINKDTQPKIYGLTQRYGLELAEQYTEGDTVFEVASGIIMRIPNGSLPDKPGVVSSEAIMKLIEDIETKCAVIDINNTKSFSAGEDMTVEEWLAKSSYNDSARDFLRLFIRALVGREAHECGLHYILDYIKSGGGYISLASEGEHGAQSLKVKKGTSAIADGLASEIALGSVYLNSPVDTIQQYGGVCTVTTVNGLTFTSKRAIIAVPTNVYQKIQFNPPLPPAKRTYVSRTMPGVYAKVVVTYSKPWWREIGLVGNFTSCVGPICFSWETSDKATEQYSLALFIAGDIAKGWHEQDSLKREEAILNHLAKLVGAQHSHLALQPLEINYKEWTKEPWIEGAPTSAAGPGELAVGGEALREPFHTLHFAGGETAREWKGYLEGALRAGSRAAEEVIQVLSSPKL